MKKDLNGAIATFHLKSDECVFAESVVQLTLTSYIRNCSQSSPANIEVAHCALPCSAMTPTVEWVLLILVILTIRLRLMKLTRVTSWMVIRLGKVTRKHRGCRVGCIDWKMLVENIGTETTEERLCYRS